MSADVAVQGHWLAVTLYIRTGRTKIAERRLGFTHLELHQLAGRIIDVDQEHALGSAVFEPVVLTAVDLHELAGAITTVARLLDAFATPTFLYWAHTLEIKPAPSQCRVRSARDFTELDFTTESRFVDVVGDSKRRGTGLRMFGATKPFRDLASQGCLPHEQD